MELKNNDFKNHPPFIIISPDELYKKIGLLFEYSMQPMLIQLT